MTFTDAVYAVDGARITGQLYRQQLRASTRSREGIILPTDLEVRELATPGTSVRIFDGDTVILGREVANQGSYFATNNGQETLPIAATGTGETRSDLIVARAEDPTFSGSPWSHDPATERIVWPRVIADVPPGTTSLQQVNPGQSGVTLARVDMPESTATVTQDLITDLRSISEPQFGYVQDSVQHPGPIEALTTTAFVDWPTSANLTIQIPTWATRCDVAVTVFSAHLVNGGANGELRIMVDGGSGDSVGWYNGNLANTNHTVGTAATFGVASIAGQDAVIKLQGNRQNSTNNGELQADTNTSVVFQLYFRETPEFNL